MIKITFTGDIMCEHTRLKHFSNNGEFDFAPIFEDVIPVFQESDYVVANLETPLAGKELVYSERNYSFNTPDAMAAALKNCGVDLVTTANNHVLDRGLVGLERTLDVLDKYGLDHTGSYRADEKPDPFIQSIDGIKVAFLSYTYGTEACFNLNYLKGNQKHQVNLTRNQELSNPIKRFLLVNKSIPAKAFRLIYRTILPQRAKMDVSDRNEKDALQIKHLKADIQKCKEAGADYTIMCLHCGGQFNDEPTTYTKALGRLCLDIGVDAVVINHEHRIQKAQFFGNKAIVYCLGNFTSNYGIQRKPADKHAEYSALFHLYLGEEEPSKYSVTFLKSHQNKQGIIVTTPIYQLIEECQDEEERVGLTEDNLWCLNTFFNLSLTEAAIKKEYFAKEYETV